MSDLKAKMYQVQFRLGLDPLQTPLGELTALPQTPSWIKGPTSKGRGGDGKGRGEGKGGNGKRRGRLGEGKGRESRDPLHAPNPYFCIRPWL